jgi:hypothetical protein
MASLGHPNRF